MARWRTSRNVGGIDDPDFLAITQDERLASLCAAKDEAEARKDRRRQQNAESARRHRAKKSASARRQQPVSNASAASANPSAASADRQQGVSNPSAAETHPETRDADRDAAAVNVPSVAASTPIPLYVEDTVVEVVCPHCWRTAWAPTSSTLLCGDCYDAAEAAIHPDCPAVSGDYGIIRMVTTDEAHEYLAETDRLAAADGCALSQPTSTSTKPT